MWRPIVAMGVLALSIPVCAAAQDFGVMNSAETINRGNFKFMANPIVLFGEDDVDSEVGVAIAGGYGFTDRVDAEAKIARFDFVLDMG